MSKLLSDCRIHDNVWNWALQDEITDEAVIIGNIIPVYELSGSLIRQGRVIHQHKHS